MKIKEITNEHTHAIVYVGAPYGLDELGELVSVHTAEYHAIQELGKLSKSPRYYNQSKIIELDQKPYGSSKTYREIFSS